MDVLLFGGTTEGRQLAAWLAARGSCEVVACSATAYGAELVANEPHVTTVVGPLSDERKRELVATRDVCCIVDATHPYARHISASLRALARQTGVELLRVVRADQDEGPWESVADAAEAARLLARTGGNVLLTTGSKELATFAAAIPNAAERLYVRVLPLASSLAAARDAGIPTSHVVAMQGPFSEEINRALLREFNIAWLVTKQSGAEGGFREKVAAARACGVRVVAIRRPEAEEGLTLAQAKARLEERYGL